MWMGHDDVLGHDYINKCVAALKQDTELVLCYAHSADIDGEGNRLGVVELQNGGASNSPSERYKHMVQYESRQDAIFGLMRSDILKCTRMHGAFDGSDWVLLAEMAVRGRFRLIPEHRCFQDEGTPRR